MGEPIKTLISDLFAYQERSEASPSDLSAGIPQTTGSPNHIFNESRLPGICNTGGVVVELLLEIECKYCHVRFCLCRSCYRGQCYCCDLCRSIAQREAHCQAQRRYRQTEKGRKTHREAERRRRLKKNGLRKKTVDDEGSTPRGPHGSLFVKAHGTLCCCHLCGVYGVIVRQFPRRGYGRRSSRNKAWLKSPARRQ